MTAPHVTHPTAEQLAAFAASHLGEAQARAVAAHLKDCPACRRAAGRTWGGTAVPQAPAVAADLPPELRAHPRYRVLRELGRGGMGVVYQAQQTIMDRPVAIKMVAGSFLDQPGAAERFHREVRSAARLSHPNIVMAYDAERVGSAYMLVMEYVEGQSLDQILRRKGPLPVAQACHYTAQAALGLQHAFERGMVHRDIKPQNLMLTPPGQVKVLDFGLARVVRESGTKQTLTSANSYMGTPDYCAPEQAADARQADIRADIYSLGCTLYALLGGHPPFQEDTAVLTILAHLQKEPRPLPEIRPDVPPELWAVVAHMLGKDPAQRYQTPAEVARALAPFCKKAAKTAAPLAFPVPALSEQPTVVPRETGRLPSLPRSAAAQEVTAVGDLPCAEVVGEEPGARQAVRRGRGRLLLAGGATVAALLLLAAGAWQVVRLLPKAMAPDGTVVLEVSEPGALVSVDGRRVESDVGDGGKSVRVTLPVGRPRRPPPG
jgi:hypothetical protein